MKLNDACDVALVASSLEALDGALFGCDACGQPRAWPLYLVRSFDRPAMIVGDRCAKNEMDRALLALVSRRIGAASWRAIGNQVIRALTKTA